MSKKPHTSRHRVPLFDNFADDPIIDERYQREVDYSTARLERAYRRAQNALQAAEKRAAKAEAAFAANVRSTRLRGDHERLQALVEDRRRELRQIAALMIPETVAGRDAHRRLVRQETGAIIIPLGDTTGERKRLKIPVFPVVVGTVDAGHHCAKE